jgi:hypothetical protein
MDVVVLHLCGHQWLGGTAHAQWIPEPGLRRAALMMCLLAFAGLIAVLVINGHANHGKCAHVRIAACVGQAPAHAAWSG